MLASPPGEGFEISDAAGRIGDRLAIHHPRSSRGAPPTVRITGIDAMHSDTPTLDFTAEKTLRSSIEKILRHNRVATPEQSQQGGCDRCHATGSNQRCLGSANDGEFLVQVVMRRSIREPDVTTIVIATSGHLLIGRTLEDRWDHRPTDSRPRLTAMDQFRLQAIHRTPPWNA